MPRLWRRTCSSERDESSLGPPKKEVAEEPGCAAVVDPCVEVFLLAAEFDGVAREPTDEFDCDGDCTVSIWSRRGPGDLRADVRELSYRPETRVLASNATSDT